MSDRWMIGWVAIGKHMGYSPRTLKNWQKYYGLPVTRVGRHVITSESALTAWLHQLIKLRRDRAAVSQAPANQELHDRALKNALELLGLKK